MTGTLCSPSSWEKDQSCPAVCSASSPPSSCLGCEGSAGAGTAVCQHGRSLGASPQPLRAGQKQTASENQGWAGEQAARPAPCFSCPPRDVPSWDTAPSASWGAQQAAACPKTPRHGPPDPARLPFVSGAAKSIPRPSAALGGRRRWGEGRHLPRLHPACAAALPPSWIPQPPLRSRSHPSVAVLPVLPVPPSMG